MLPVAAGHDVKGAFPLKGGCRVSDRGLEVESLHPQEMPDQVGHDARSPAVKAELRVRGR